MGIFDTAIAILATIALFLHGLHGFSKQIQRVGSEQLKGLLRKLTRYRIGGVLLGAVFTAFVQSSSAVTSITVSLVDAGVISFQQSLAVLLGANIGTTVTAWLVAFKVQGAGAVFIVLGALLSMIPWRVNLFGRTFFYFGFILFSLELISQNLGPLKNSPELAEWLLWANHPLLGFGIGFLLTALVQSSSVITGLLILLIAQGMLSLPLAIAIILGSNVGSSITALIAAAPLGKWAKRAALANSAFNIGGGILFLPFVGMYSEAIALLSSDPATQASLAHLFFNIIVCLIFVGFLGPIGRLISGNQEQAMANGVS